MKNVIITVLINSCIQIQVVSPRGAFHREELLNYSFALQWNLWSCKLAIFSVSVEAEINEIFFITSMLHLKSWWAIKYLFALVGLHSTSLAGYLPHVALTITISNVLNPRNLIWNTTPKMQDFFFFFSSFLSRYRECSLVWLGFYHM